MSNGQTTVSGVRTGGISRRTDNLPRPRRIPLGLSVHVVLVTLAVLVWFIARDMVSETLTLQEASRLRVELSEELRGAWRIQSGENTRISVKVSGPSKRINDFASELDANPTRYTYTYLITANDLPTGAGTPRPVTLRVDMTRVRPSPESEAPAELVIETLKEDRVYQVVVEPFVTREAYVDVAEGILGKVPGYTCTPLVPAGTQLQVHGPLSRVEALGGRDGKARLVPAGFNVLDFIDARRRSLNRSMEELLGQQKKETAPVLLASRDDVVIQQLTGDNGTAEVVTHVTLEFEFTRELERERMRRRFPVTVAYPSWMSSMMTRASGVDEEYELELLVAASQRDQFNENNVRVLVDLSDMSQADFEVVDGKSLSEPGTHTLRPRREVFYSLVIDKDRLSYRIPGDGRATERQHSPILGLTIEVITN